MIRTARLHQRSWRTFWDAIDRPSWLGSFITQVGGCEEAVPRILSLVEPLITSALARAKSPSAWSAATTTNESLLEARTHSDALPGVLAGVGNLLTVAPDSRVQLRQICDSIREIVGAERMAEAFLTSSWCTLESPLRHAKTARLSRPLLPTGQYRVRATANQRIYVVEPWLVVEYRTHEVHHSMRWVEHLEWSEELE
ncbi:MAG: hypothetical protein KF729_00025 [Sandaracinaceae bacterium]|nr:hypothetical protein [Sandaracinaceae bacterium]